LKKVVQSPEVLLYVISGASNYSMSLLYVTWTLLKAMSYYNAFKRSTDDKTRHCQPEEAHNFASSENSNNVEPQRWQKPTGDYGFIQNWIISYV
jgi:hypothetical protein